MDQELQFLINTIYGNNLNEKQLANIIKMAQSNPQYLENMRNTARSKMPAAQYKGVSPLAVQRAMNEANIQTPKLGTSSFTFDKNAGKATNDMSAISDFKQAFATARKGGHKNFFWKKTKANPSGMFSTELATEKKPVSQPQEPLEEVDDTLDVELTKIPIDKSKINKTSWELAAEEPVPYMFDDFQLMHGNPGYNVYGSQYRTKFEKGGTMNKVNYFRLGGQPQNAQANPVDMLIEALNGGADIKTISGIIQQSGQDPQVIVQEIAARAQQGDQSAVTALSVLEKLMKNSQSAKLGAKLAYIQKLKGICPEGSEKIYLKNGGCVCAQKAEKGDQLKKQGNQKQINPNDTVNTKFGPRDLNGKTKFPKWNPTKENYDHSTRARVQEKDEKSGKKVFGSACGSKLKPRKRK